MKATRFFPLFPLVVAMFVVGCNAGHKSVKRVYVSGKITLDSKPLTTGNITFEPGTGEVPASLDILDGAYEGKVPLGKNTVRITATKKISMKEKMGFDGPGYDQLVEINMLPDRYHAKSTITRDVEEGENKFNFDLISK